MFAALSLAALAVAGVMAVAGPPNTDDAVALAAQEKATVAYVAQNAGTAQPQL